MLTSEQILHFETFGFLVVKKVFYNDEMKNITTVFEKGMSDDRNGRPFDGEERQSIFGMVERNAELVDLVVDKRIYGSISQLFGPGFIWTASDGNFCVGETQSHPDRHDRTWPLINVALYLDSVSKDTGCLRVIPGSHKVPCHSDLNKYSFRKGSKLQKDRLENFLSIDQTFESIKDIKILQREKFFENNFIKLIKSQEKQKLFLSITNVIPRFAFEMLTIIMIVFIII